MQEADLGLEERDELALIFFFGHGSSLRMNGSDRDKYIEEKVGLMVKQSRSMVVIRWPWYLLKEEDHQYMSCNIVAL